jgi:hypothetical protein
MSIVQYVTRQARKIPGIAQAAGEIKGTFAKGSDLPIPGYDDMTADAINEKLPALPQAALATLDGYERKHQSRTTILSKIATLRGTEPWLGYDELTVVEIEKVLAAIDDPGKLDAVRAYEQAHKSRSTVIDATEREATTAGG